MGNVNATFTLVFSNSVLAIRLQLSHPHSDPWIFFGGVNWPVLP